MHVKTVCIILMLASTSCYAVDGAYSKPAATQLNPTKQMDPAADELLKRATDYLQAAKTLTVKAVIEYEVFLRSGHKVQLERQADVLLERPDKLRAEITGDVPNRQLFYDGKTVTIYNVDHNAYAVIEAPNTIDAMMDFLYETFDVPLPLADVLVNDPAGNYDEHTTFSKYLGLHDVDGEPCHHVLLSNDEIDYQLWILDGPEPLLRKIVINYVNEPGVPQYTARLGDWERDTQTTRSMFEFVPPDGADEIDIIPLATAKGEKK